MKRHWKKILVFCIGAGFLAIIAALLIDHQVEKTGRMYLVAPQDAPAADAVLVLGAYVTPSGRVSDMLRDRLTVGLELYQAGRAPKLLVSGDHGQKEYDEVNAMKQFLKDQQVSSQDIFMDHAGFSTYESIYRARDIFQVKRVIIVTQEYHLVRALFIARELGLEAYGVPADRHYYGQVMQYYHLREIAARNKDYLLAKVFRPKPTFLGEAIPVSGDGRATDDK